MAFLRKMLTQIREYFGKMARKDKIRLAIISAAVIVLAVVAVILLSRTNYVTLYTAQSNAEAGAIYETLQGMNVPAKVSGTTVLVPEGRQSELLALLATRGVIGADDTNLDILNSASGFNITDSQAKKLYEAQLASQIRGQLLATDKILRAIVTVNMGESSPFIQAQSVKDATAAVMLVIKDDAMLSSPEARAIAELVRNSIPGIKYENITISDSNLNIYPVTESDAEAAASPTPTADTGIDINSRFALQNQLSMQLKDQGEQLLTPIFGASNVQVIATVRLNFDKTSVDDVVFNPPVPGELDGIVRSSSEIYENQAQDAAAQGVPGTDSNGMGTVEYPYGTLDNGTQYGRMVSEKNYEINETRTQIEKESGAITFLSIGVILNSDTITTDYTSQVANIVSKGFGIQPDNVAVEMVQFSALPDSTASNSNTQAENNDAQAQRQQLLETILMWVVILLLGIAFMLLVRTIVRTVKPPPPVPEPVFIDGGGAGSIDYLAGDDESFDFEEEPEEIEDIELNKKSTGLEQIERFIDKDPSSVAQLLRNWLTDDQ